MSSNNKIATVAVALILHAAFVQAQATETKTAQKSETKTDEKSDTSKTKKVETVKFVVDQGLTLNIPKTWKKKPNASRMRKGTFEIPAVKGDEDPAELTLFNFPGNEVNANFTRWIGQFGGEGRKMKMIEGKAGDNKYYVLNVSGTYNKPVGPPIAGRTQPTPNSRMLGVILPIKGKGMYFLKLAGPDKTVAKQMDHLRKSFGGVEKTEMPYAF